MNASFTANIKNARLGTKGTFQKSSSNLDWARKAAERQQAALAAKQSN